MIRVLIIGGRHSGRHHWKDFLQARGYRVYQAETTSEGFRRCSGILPDLLILDLDAILPASQALTTIRELRSTRPDIQILAFSSFVSRKKALEAGANVCIASPADDGLVLELADTMTGGIVDEISMGVTPRRGLLIGKEPAMAT